MSRYIRELFHFRDVARPGYPNFSLKWHLSRGDHRGALSPGPENCARIDFQLTWAFEASVESPLDRRGPLNGNSTAAPAGAFLN